MKFSLDTHSYLAGDKFSSGLTVPIARPEATIADRFSLLEGYAKGRKVVHLGFADHAELVDRKIRQDIWLHARLSRVATRCAGVDVNAAAVEHIKVGHGYGDVYVHDMTDPRRLDEVASTHWDWLFMPEVLEHVDNPVHFLQQLRVLYGTCFDRVLITVPNAFELTNLRFLVRQKECINTDHRYWFTPFTLAKVCERAGWRVDEFSFCQNSAPQSLHEKALLRAFPALRECVVMIIRVQ